MGNIFDCSVSSKAEERVADAPDVFDAESSQFFMPRFLRSGRRPLRGVDELHPAPAMLRLAVAQRPDVGSDAGVVEHVERQGDDGFQPVVLDDPAADVALALTGVAGEE